MFYKLDGKNPVECINGQVWAEWYENAGDQRIVAQAEHGQFFVSTTFTGIDPTLAMYKDGPLLFETMIFKGGKATGNIIRSSTWDAAEAAHQSALKWVQQQPSDTIAGFIKKGMAGQQAVDDVLAKYASDPASHNDQNDTK